MSYAHNMYHYPGMTDLDEIKARALSHSQVDSPVIVHLHGYDERGCRKDASKHITFKQGKEVPSDVARNAH